MQNIISQEQNKNIYYFFVKKVKKYGKIIIQGIKEGD